MTETKFNEKPGVFCGRCGDDADYCVACAEPLCTNCDKWHSDVEGAMCDSCMEGLSSGAKMPQLSIVRNSDEATR